MELDDDGQPLLSHESTPTDISVRNRHSEPALSSVLRQMTATIPRQRRRWTSDEDSVLLRMHIEEQIAVNLTGRTNVDCKDRMRTINRNRNRSR